MKGEFAEERNKGIMKAMTSEYTQKAVAGAVNDAAKSKWGEPGAQ